jgi:hypothetical protein
MKSWGRFGLLAAIAVCIVATMGRGGVLAAAGPAPETSGSYHVLAPIESGNLLLFPVVQAAGKQIGETPFLTLDEGLRSGEVEVTEAGRVRGLVRQRPHSDNGAPAPGELFEPRRRSERQSAQVNTLVLVNHSKKPLLLLAGEIVTGGKQDRVIARDRIVPPEGDPIDLGVFCIEPGRWVEKSATFGTSGTSSTHSFMVQPTVRQRAMVDKDQQQVWDSVHGAIAKMQLATTHVQSAGIPAGSAASLHSFGTTSYAQVMQNSEVSEKVDEAAAPVMKSRDKVLAKLRSEHAIGVVVAIHGQIVWADLFASTDLLSRYWTKLVRSYAAESVTSEETGGKTTVAQAQRFLDAPAGGTETSEGLVGVYRNRELKSGSTETFVLESLLPGATYDVHLSKLRLREARHIISRPRPVIEELPFYR